MTKNKTTISALIIACNEEVIIADCLDSVVSWADETLVRLDEDTVDKTAQIVEKHGGKVVRGHVTTSFADRRNNLTKYAKGDWLFYIDADERCTPKLATEIQSVVNLSSPNSKFQVQSSKYVAYDIPRANIRLTKPLFHGGWWPDCVTRLIKKQALTAWEGELHEQPKIQGKIGRLTNHFIHLSHRGSYEHKFDTTIKYSKTEADKLYQDYPGDHPPMTIARFIVAMNREFWKRLIIFQGYKDGLEGVLEVIYQVFSVFVTYARLWELQQTPRADVSNQKHK